MSYSSRGSKPFERASKSSHHHIVNDSSVQYVLSELDFPPREYTMDIKDRIVKYSPVKESKIKNIIAVDGGYTEANVRTGYPSSVIHFFQFGALYFKREDLQKLDLTPHIAPEDMAKLNNIHRLKLPLPTKGVRRRGTSSLLDSVRLTIHEFFSKEKLGESSSLLDTLKWFVFRRYKSFRNDSDKVCDLMSTSPYESVKGPVILNESEMNTDGTFTCASTGKILYLIDIFRLHEVIHEDSGAAGVCGYLAGVIEHLIALHIIRHLLMTSPSSLNETIFIMDRPTGLFGQVARLHEPMKELVNWLFDNHQLYWAGLEKSGAFVEHANMIKDMLEPGSIFILGDKHIYRFISPGEESPNRPYANTSYYGHKVIFKTPRGQMHVVSVPVRELKKEPDISDLNNLMSILTLVEELHCDMYESALIPIALVNKLVSLSSHPSSQILQAFAKSSISSY
jgi:hypothetical protein